MEKWLTWRSRSAPLCPLPPPSRRAVLPPLPHPRSSAEVASPSCPSHDCKEKENRNQLNNFKLDNCCSIILKSVFFHNICCIYYFFSISCASAKPLGLSFFKKVGVLFKFVLHLHQYICLPLNPLYFFYLLYWMNTSTWVLLGTSRRSENEVKNLEFYELPCIEVVNDLPQFYFYDFCENFS